MEFDMENIDNIDSQAETIVSDQVTQTPAKEVILAVNNGETKIDYDVIEEDEKLSKKDILNIIKLFFGLITIVSIILTFSWKESFTGLIIFVISFIALTILVLMENE